MREGAPHRVTAAPLSAGERAWLEARAPAELGAVLAVFTGEGVPSAGFPAIAGACALDAEGLHFRPRFPFVPGLRYTVRLDLGAGVPILFGFEVPSPAGPRPRVVAMFPSGETLPENTLRLYLHFSQPMNARDAQRHVRLFEDGEAEVTLAFVEIEHGLWDPRRTRLTLLFHPGRIKRGVGPEEDLGPPLRAGRNYRLVVEASLQDDSGIALGQDFERHFRAITADRESPSASGLRVQPPHNGEDSLVVDLPEPLDEALLHRLLWVEDGEGRPIAGTLTVGEGETRWTFRPTEAWSAGGYAVRAHPALEDRAGNRFDRVFDREDRPGAAAEEGTSAAEPIKLVFSVPAR